MTNLKATELAKLTGEELDKKLKELKKELIKVSIVNTQEKNTATRSKNIKRNIARVLTVKRLKEI